MPETIDSEIKENILEISNIEEAAHDFEKIGDGWYGSLGFEFRSDDPVEMVNLFRQDRPEDVIYYRSGEKIGDKKYRFQFIVKDENVRLEERAVGRFNDFEEELREIRKDLPEIAEVNDGFVFQQDTFDDFVVETKERLVDPEVPVSVHYLTPDSVSVNEDGEAEVDGVAINSNVYVRKEKGTIYELRNQNSDE